MIIEQIDFIGYMGLAGLAGICLGILVGGWIAEANCINQRKKKVLEKLESFLAHENKKL